MNLINNLRGGHCFRSSRTRRITGGKITTIKLGHPAFDGGIRWCMFPQCFFQKGVNFLRRLALQEKKTWWQLASRCCWNRVRRLTCFFSASVRRKDSQFGTRTDPSFQRHYQFRPMTLGRAKDLSAPPRINQCPHQPVTFCCLKSLKAWIYHMKIEKGNT